MILSESAVGAPIGIAGARFTLIFFFNHSNNENITKHNKNQKERG